MLSTAVNVHMCQRTHIPELVSNDDAQSPQESKARLRSVSTNASTVTLTTNEAASTTNTIPTPGAGHDDSLQRIGKLIQDFSHSDNAKVNDALYTLYLLAEPKTSDSVVAAGGCLALVLLVKGCLNKATGKIPACHQVTELNELAELKTLCRSLRVITDLTNMQNVIMDAITAVGGVEAVVEVMKQFPKCRALQSSACDAIRNLARCSIGKNQAVETGGIKVLLAAINNHLSSALVCERACWALSNIVTGSKENTELLIFLGGATAVAKVRTMWQNNDAVQTMVGGPNNDEVQTRVGRLAKLISVELATWADFE
jgi:hypothetical protein